MSFFLNAGRGSVVAVGHVPIRELEALAAQSLPVQEVSNLRVCPIAVLGRAYLAPLRGCA